MKVNLSLSLEQWNAIALAAKRGILAADMLGPDDRQWHISELETQAAHAAVALVETHLKDQILKRPTTPPVSIEVPKFPSSQAYKEGWCFDLDELADAWVIRRVEDMFDKTFASDRHALAFVHGRAALGSTYHEDALLWLETANSLQRATAAAVKPVAMLEAAE